MTLSTIAPVRKTVTVHASPERAFDVFTAGFGDWWPLATHHTGEHEAVTVTLEPGDGGRWFETSIDGAETMWGYVRTWEPPHRLVLAWHLDAAFRFDPDRASEVEVTFVAGDASTTVVTLEHRGLDVHGDAAPGLRSSLDEGWLPIIEEFAARLA